MADHEVRLATMADFEGVMNIGDVYDGVDYLRHYYQSYIDDTYIKPYIYLIGDEVVAFSAGVLIDSGHTLITRAGRVRSDYRDQGIFGQLMKHVYNEYSQIEGVDFEVMTTNAINYEAKKDKLPKQFTEEYATTFESVLCDASDIDVPVSTAAASSIVVLTQAEILSIFSTEGTREDLFPFGRLIVDWCPYKPLASNLKYILKSGGLAVATKGAGKKTLLMTISTFFPCELGFKYTVDVFGTDQLRLQEHLILHLKHMQTLTDGKVLFQVVADENHVNTKEVLTKLKLQPLDDPFNTIQYFGRKFYKRE